MLRISLRQLWEHKLRTLLLGGAILLGVSFVVASFILTDSIGDAFEGVFTEALADIDIQITPDPDLETSSGFEVARIPGGLEDDIAAVAGVATVEAGLQDFVVIRSPEEDDGGGFGAGFGPPTFGISWPEGPGPWTLAEGRAPVSEDEIALDVTTAEELGLVVGDSVEVAPRVGRFSEYRVVGLISFGDSNTLLGVTFVAFTYEHAEELFGAAGQASAYAVTVTPGTDVDAVVDTLNETVLPAEAVAVNARTAAESQSEDLRAGLGFVTVFLLVFAGIALVVGAFVVYNAFGVVLAQRTRELGLLRVLGATRGDVTRLVLGEAALLGLSMSILGVPGGLAVAWAAREGLDRFAGGIPAAGLPVAGRTVVVALAVGTAVAVISALLPAQRANRVAPMAALRDQPELAVVRPWVATVGAGLVAVSAAVLVWSAFTAGGGGVSVGDTEALLPAGLGTFGLFCGLVLLARSLAAPIIGLLGRPARALTAELARENARRTPARTATTATSLMIGVGLVVMVAILIVSLQDTIEAALEDSFQGDLIVGPAGFNLLLGVPVEAYQRVGATEGVAAVARTNLVEARLDDGRSVFVMGVDPAEIDLFLTFAEVEGTFDDLVGDAVALQRVEADAKGYRLGDAVEMTIRGSTLTFEVVAIWRFPGPADNVSHYLPYDTVRALMGRPQDAQVVVFFEEGADPAVVRAAVEEELADFANIQVTSLEDVSQLIATGLQGIQVFLTVLLLASVFVALFGIVLTLYLAVHERTREIGLLRAVGMTRPQLAATVRWEAVFIGLFGSVLGLALGLGGGWALTAAIIGEGASLAVPWGWILGSLVGGAVAGLVASLVPAAAATRLDVLKAITYE